MKLIEHSIEDGYLVIRIPLKIGDQKVDLSLAQAIERLTVAECKVFRGLLQGLCYKEMADKASCSVSSIKFHVGNIYRKLGVTCRYELQRNFR